MSVGIGGLPLIQDLLSSPHPTVRFRIKSSHLRLITTDIGSAISSLVGIGAKGRFCEDIRPPLCRDFRGGHWASLEGQFQQPLELGGAVGPLVIRSSSGVSFGLYHPVLAS